MPTPINRCPLCEGQLVPVRLQCHDCEVSIEGQLPTSRLVLLTNEQQEFVEAFLLARGNIKEVERELGISYPTVRKKLDQVVEALGHAPAAARQEREEILDAIESGDMTPQQGIAAMQKLNRS
ncbi:MAG: DUF2089 domain-containing protein [Gemmatimonadetes bacterium]|jgi:hypothetical protein|nr:DUF2089 domain-containing protein [Gemmatimonadota bacterium]MBT5058460.1 DUF2089 domain-containing protein [Gemmatimonadota bacterium]MBT5141286.1 DUF2089 domain-containing protein [Gemmatimonadota bacterium]MBT5590367.1 DUF2089 domain-containing protein [Gemmatimonadota bacterium]MBT5963900.1 DUF2089 domain-containing protein [Gemmatimonadota bacterium]